MEYNVSDLTEGCGQDMRRKCLTLTAILIAFLTVLHGSGVPLRIAGLDHLMGEEHIFTGKVITVEEKEEEYFRLVVRLMTCDGEKLERREGAKVLISYYDGISEPWELVNRVISFSTQLGEADERRNPGCFDYRLYLKSRGIDYTGRITEFADENVRPGPVDRAEAFLIKMRFLFARSLKGEGKGLVMGLLFGDTSALSDDVYEQFQKNGTAHILAVSGLHMGILYGIYRKIAGRKRSWPAMALLGIFIFAYGTISLWSTSVIRASLMIAMNLMAQALDLRYDMTTGLSAVALLLILRNPYVIFGTGFQMSFLAILSICFLCPVMPKWLPDSLKGPVAVNLGLAVYQMYQFNYISFVAILANIPIVFLAGILVPLALAGFLIFMVLGTMGPLEYLIDSLSLLLMKINEISALGGYGSVEVVSPPLGAVLAFYFLLFFMASEYSMILRLRGRKKFLYFCVAAGIVISMTAGHLWTSPISKDDIVFVDVGQGDCLHIRAGNRNVLIDGGGSIRYNTGKNTLKPYLLKNGTGHIDAAIATHLHTDHYRGLVELAEVYPVKNTLTGLTIGKIIRLTDDVVIETLWPVTIEGENGQDENHQCSVFMVYYEGWKIMITGDLDEEGERLMIREYEGTDKLSADILKIGHHGSGTSTCDEFLEAVDPQVAVIQVGAGNTYGHPDGKIIEKCEKNGIIVLRNDYDGAIGFSFGKTEFSYHVQKRKKRACLQDIFTRYK